MNARVPRLRLSIISFFLHNPSLTVTPRCLNKQLGRDDTQVRVSAVQHNLRYLADLGFLKAKVRLDARGLTYQLDDTNKAPKIEKTTSLTDDVLKAIQVSTHPLSAQDINEILGRDGTQANVDVIRNTLRGLFDRGLILREAGTVMSNQIHHNFLYTFNLHTEGDDA